MNYRPLHAAMAAVTPTEKPTGPFARWSSQSTPRSEMPTNELDAASRDHLDALLRQAIANVNLKALLSACFNSLLAVLTPNLLEHLSFDSPNPSNATTQLNPDPASSKPKLPSQRAASSSKQDPAQSATPSPLAKSNLVICIKETPCNASEPRALRFQEGQFEQSLLFGQGSFDRQATDQPVGGTWFITAPHSELDKMFGILQLATYAVIHLVLEVNLYRDMDCARPVPAGKVNASVAAKANEMPGSLPTLANLALTPTASNPISLPARLPTLSLKPFATIGGLPRSQKTHSTFGSYWPFSSSKTDSPPHSPMGRTIIDFMKQAVKPGRSRGDSVSSLSSQRTVHLKRRNTGQGLAGGRMIEDYFWVDRHPAPAGSSSVTPPSSSPISPAHNRNPNLGSLSPPNAEDDHTHLSMTDSSDPSERFARVIERMNTALLSVSPDVKFPPPRLIQRLRDQEAALSTAESRSEPSTARSNLSKTSGRIALDARAGLNSLMSNNNSLDGIIRHQSCQFLYEKICLMSKPSAPPCESPRTILLPYYRFLSDNSHLQDGQDVRLGKLLRLLVDRANDKCSNANCDRVEMEHLISLTHLTTKVSLRVRAPSDQEAPLEQSGTTVVWTRCAQCGQVSQPSALSTASSSISFGKYLELLLYASKSLAPREDQLCKHPQGEEGLFHIVRCFLLGSKVVELSTEPQELFELRLPTSIAEHQDGFENTMPGATAESQPNNQLADKTREEIDTYYRSLRKRTLHIKTILPEDDMDLFDKITNVERSFNKHLQQLLAYVDFGSRNDLNSVRKMFLDHAKADATRLALWESKYLSTPLAPIDLVEPSYFTEGYHTFPGSHILVKESNPSSFLAYALSSSIFQHELRHANTSQERLPVQQSPKRIVSAPATAFPFSAGSRFVRAFTSAPASEASSDSGSIADPDDDAASFAETASYDCVATPKTVLKSPASLLLRPLHAPKSTDVLSIDGVLKGSEPPAPSGGPQAPAPMSRQTSMASFSDDRVLEEFLRSDEQPVDNPRAPLKRTKTNLPNLIAALSRRPHASEASTMSASSIDLSNQAQGGEFPTTLRSDATYATLQPGTASKSRSAIDPDLFSEFTGSIKGLASYGSHLIPASIFKNRQTSEASAASQIAAPESPHVKLKMRRDTKFFSVTVWFAKDFAKLRKSCDITEASFVQSLSECVPFQTSGGKTAANFYTTANGRYVLKQLINRFSGSERDSMLNLGPAYFAHFSTEPNKAAKPSLLAKIFAFFTYKIKLEGQEAKRVDMIVLENMFPPQETITRRFDLKGIRTRGIKALETNKDKTLFDQDWLETYRALLLIFPHSKRIMRDAINFDTEFLSGQGIVDYSLLIGVDDTNKTLITGVIDILSIFNIQKLLESKGKQALKSKEQVTIVRPDECALMGFRPWRPLISNPDAARFVDNILHSFLSVPEKWTASEKHEKSIKLQIPI